jgi:hypothetical protein
MHPCLCCWVLQTPTSVCHHHIELCYYDIQLHIHKQPCIRLYHYLDIVKTITNHLKQYWFKVKKFIHVLLIICFTSGTFTISVVSCWNIRCSSVNWSCTWDDEVLEKSFKLVCSLESRFILSFTFAPFKGDSTSLERPSMMTEVLCVHL